MNGYGFFAVMRYLLLLAGVILFGVAVSIAAVWSEIAREISYHRKFGDQWKAEYEDVYGSLSEGRTRMVIGFVAFVALVSVTIWLYRILRKDSHAPSRRRSKHRHGGSSLEWSVRCRRNALLGIYFGVPGIIASVVMEMIPLGIVRHFSDQQVLGIFVFVFGYIAVISGCWWWLKAKGWNEVIVFIGIAPLVILFIPFVRLIFLSAPALLLVAMVMMPLILVVVVLTLPDKSGNRRQRSSWSSWARSSSSRTNAEESQTKPSNLPQARR
jgi:hypothetical protein